MIDWMNVLTLQAYEVELDSTTMAPAIDPVTGGFIYVKTADGQPVVNETLGPRFVNRVKSYQGLLDFMQEVTGFFGFYAPDWRGVYQ